MKTILVIDDEDAITGYLDIVLSRMGYIVTVSNCSIKGLELMKSIRFDILICDIIMPEIDGLGILNELNKKKRNGEEIPSVIMMSGIGQFNAVYLDDAKKLGAKIILAKPFSNSDLGFALDSLES